MYLLIVVWRAVILLDTHAGFYFVHYSRHAWRSWIHFKGWRVYHRCEAGLPFVPFAFRGILMTWWDCRGCSRCCHRHNWFLCDAHVACSMIRLWWLRILMRCGPYSMFTLRESTLISILQSLRWFISIICFKCACVQRWESAACTRTKILSSIWLWCFTGARA